MNNNHRIVFKTLLLCASAVILSFNIQLNAQDDLRNALFGLPDAIFEQIKTAEGYEASYEIKFKQPLDHNHPEMDFFYQRIYLNHRGFDSPTILVTEGYERDYNRLYELSDFVGGNQILVEHRYYGTSTPDSMDYTYLNLAQATADLHKVRKIFGAIYNGPWLSTGISKGGMTTLYYRYFYPEDVEVSVPYVAPINLAYKDRRIYEFLKTAGTIECRKAIESFQRYMLEHKDTFLPLMKWWSKGQDFTFDRLSIETAYELTVLEFSFSFWQLGHDCNTIPDLNVGRDSLLSYFLNVSSIDFFSDQTIDGYKPFYYQMGSEMGYYGYETEQFSELLTAVKEEPSAVFPPENVDITYDPTMTVKAHEYFVNEAEGVVYINGASDTWSATGVRPDPSLDVLVYYLEGKDHVKARIKYMSPQERKMLEEFLERQLNRDIPGYKNNPDKP